MRPLKLEEAQALMAVGTFVTHQSEPSTGYKRTPVGNVETHDGRTLNSANFWYERSQSEFHDGWHLFPLIDADNHKNKSLDTMSKHDLAIRCNEKNSRAILDALMDSIENCQITFGVLGFSSRTPSTRREITVRSVPLDTALTIEQIVKRIGCNFIATYKGARFYVVDPDSPRETRLMLWNEPASVGFMALQDALAALTLHNR